MSVLMIALATIGGIFAIGFVLVMFALSSMNAPTSRKTPQAQKEALEKDWKKFITWGWWILIGILTFHLLYGSVLIGIPAKSFDWFWKSPWRYLEILLVAGSFGFLFWKKVSRATTPSSSSPSTKPGTKPAETADSWDKWRIIIAIISFAVLFTFNMNLFGPGGLAFNPYPARGFSFYISLSGLMYFGLAWTGVTTLRSVKNSFVSAIGNICGLLTIFIGWLNHWYVPFTAAHLVKHRLGEFMLPGDFSINIVFIIFGVWFLSRWVGPSAWRRPMVRLSLIVILTAGAVVIPQMAAPFIQF